MEARAELLSAGRTPDHMGCFVCDPEPPSVQPGRVARGDGFSQSAGAVEIPDGAMPSRVRYSASLSNGQQPPTPPIPNHSDSLILRIMFSNSASCPQPAHDALNQHLILSPRRPGDHPSPGRDRSGDGAALGSVSAPNHSASTPSWSPPPALHMVIPRLFGYHVTGQLPPVRPASDENPDLRSVHRFLKLHPPCGTPERNAPFPAAGPCAGDEPARTTADPLRA